MPVSVLSSCTEACGWTAAVICVAAFGSFGVPLKYTAKVDAHPLVMQSYKTIVCFLTSWCVVLLGEEIRWTSWGIVSGIFWVPGATCGVYGIRNAGLAVAVGTWSSIIVLTSFFFGIIVFQERVKHFIPACCAFICLIVGLMGMSRYSAQQPEKEGLYLMNPRKSLSRSLSTSHSDINDGPVVLSTAGMSSMEIEPLVLDDETVIMGAGTTNDDIDGKISKNKDRIILLGGKVSLTRRQMGILGAVINGGWGGMNLIPLHYALRDEGLTGAGYLISYAGGALIVNTALWILLYAYYLYQKKGQWQEALDSLPKFHFSELGQAGLMAGILYSIGNFTSILAVTYLGQGTGYSFCQMQLFVSGLWGVFYFREIKGTETITKWFASAAVAVTGIIWLSYEHEGGRGGH